MSKKNDAVRPAPPPYVEHSDQFDNAHERASADMALLKEFASAKAFAADAAPGTDDDAWMGILQLADRVRADLEEMRRHETAECDELFALHRGRRPGKGEGKGGAR